MSQESPTGLRTRSYTYAAPDRGPSRWKGVSGLDAMRQLIGGAAPPPPIASTLDFTLVQVDPGVAAFEGQPAEWLENPLGTVHGGWISTLLDSALGCAVHSTLAPGMAYTSATLEVKFLRPVLATTGRLRAEGRVLHGGSRLAVVSATLTGVADGKLYASATSTCMIFEAR
jgi:uncharacterized protein (TIGR00369 family)